MGRPNQNETWVDKFSHLRTWVVAIVAIPMIFFFAMGLFAPRKAPVTGTIVHESAPVSHDKYAVVIDAGSTGSRVHAFHFTETPTGQFDLVVEDFHQLKPGLSSHASDPEAGAESLRPLLEKAIEIVPKELQSATTISVRATAGLRMLPGDQSAKLVKAVKTFLDKFPFKHDDSSVSIMDGADEGAFQWLTINYLSGKLGKEINNTVAAVDLGGGSVQLAHAMQEVRAAKAPSGYVRPLHGNGRVYDVYVHSYLGYGLMAARGGILGLTSPTVKACITSPKGLNYSYGGKTYVVKDAGKKSAVECAKAATESLHLNKSCAPAPSKECGFDGAWGGAGGDGTNTFYVSSYFFDRAAAVGIVEGKAIRGLTTVGAFDKAAKDVCSVSAESLPKEYPAVSSSDAPFMCLDIAYCYALLNKGFKLKYDQEITLVKQIEYKGSLTEAAWPLGAAIESLSRAAAESKAAAGSKGG